jgi:hypothetical protein
MAAPDPLAVRGYNAEAKRRRTNAERALSEATKKVERLRELLMGDGDPGLALGEAQRLGVDVAELVVHLAGLAALHDVEFLTTDPDAEER